LIGYILATLVIATEIFEAHKYKTLIERKRSMFFVRGFSSLGSGVPRVPKPFADILLK
jgi:hypothetical protein